MLQSTGKTGAAAAGKQLAKAPAQLEKNRFQCYIM
jgi:hypothetical protein